MPAENLFLGKFQQNLVQLLYNYDKQIFCIVSQGLLKYYVHIKTKVHNSCYPTCQTLDSPACILGSRYGPIQIHYQMCPMYRVTHPIILSLSQSGFIWYMLFMQVGDDNILGQLLKLFLQKLDRESQFMRSDDIDLLYHEEEPDKGLPDIETLLRITDRV